MYYLNGKLIDSACRAGSGSLINKQLKELCKKYPSHKVDKQIIAKVLIIGRTYSATLERRRSSNKGRDNFYNRKVAPKIRKSCIDSWLHELRDLNKVSDRNLGTILKVHFEVMGLFKKINGNDNKRSLSSKYLHFHFPNLFFIYDSRSSWAASKLIKLGKNKTLGVLKNNDPQYATFVKKCLELRSKIHKKHNKMLNPRSIDNVLLKIYSRRDR